MKKILIVVDFQNDFIDGVLGTKEAVSIIPNVEEKVKKYTDNDDIIICTQDTHHHDYLDSAEGKALPVPHCIFETTGWEIHSSIKDYLVTSNKNTNAYFVSKQTFGSTYLALLIGDLKNMYGDIELEIIGLCTDICVMANVILLKTFFPNIPITVDEKCCAGVTPEKHASAIDVLRSQQVNII